MNCVVLALSCCVGCAVRENSASATTYEVKGKILLADGRPLTRGRVTFVPKEGMGPEASGEIGSNGEFSLTTRSPDDGAIPGEYKVRVEPARSSDRKVAARPEFPNKYVDEDSSGLIVVVAADSNRLDPIRLK